MTSSKTPLRSNPVHFCRATFASSIQKDAMIMARKTKDMSQINYFNNRSTNAAAESLSSKMKGFRAQVRGVSDLPFFMYRMMKIFG